MPDTEVTPAEMLQQLEKLAIEYERAHLIAMKRLDQMQHQAVQLDEAARAARKLVEAQRNQLLHAGLQEWQLAIDDDAGLGPEPEPVDSDEDGDEDAGMMTGITVNLESGEVTMERQIVSRAERKYEFQGQTLVKAAQSILKDAPSPLHIDELAKAIFNLNSRAEFMWAKNTLAGSLARAVRKGEVLRPEPNTFSMPEEEVALVK